MFECFITLIQKITECVHDEEKKTKEEMLSRIFSLGNFPGIYYVSFYFLETPLSENECQDFLRTFQKMYSIEYLE